MPKYDITQIRKNLQMVRAMNDADAKKAGEESGPLAEHMANLLYTHPYAAAIAAGIIPDDSED